MKTILAFFRFSPILCTLTRHWSEISISVYWHNYYWMQDSLNHFLVSTHYVCGDYLRCNSKLGFQKFWSKVLWVPPTQVFQECWSGVPPPWKWKFGQIWHLGFDPPNEKLDRSWHFGFELVWSTVSWNFLWKPFLLQEHSSVKTKKEKKRDKLHWSIFNFQIFFFNFAKFTEFNDKKTQKSSK